MTSIRTCLTSSLAALVLGLASVPAQATVALPTTTFTFNGNCADCAQANESSAYPVSASLVLQNYQIGDSFTMGNFVSFTYGPTNLLPGGATWFAGDIESFTGSFAGNPSALSGDVNIFTPTIITDPLQSDPNAEDFLTDTGTSQFSFFQSTTSGAYAIGLLISTFSNNVKDNDNGTGTWSTVVATDPGNNVPEPGSLLLVGAALAALGVARRRRS